VLVSYFVPLDGDKLCKLVSDTDMVEEKSIVRGMWKYRHLVKDVKEHLKKKLPSYSVPSGKVEDTQTRYLL